MPLEINHFMATYKNYVDSETYHESRFVIDRLLNQKIEELNIKVELDHIKESYLVGDVRILITTEFESPLKEGSKNFTKKLQNPTEIYITLGSDKFYQYSDICEKPKNVGFFSWNPLYTPTDFYR